MPVSADTCLVQSSIKSLTKGYSNILDSMMGIYFQTPFALIVISIRPCLAIWSSM